MRVVVRHPATPPVDIDLDDEAVVVHACEYAVPGRVVEHDAGFFAEGYCPLCHEWVALEEGAVTEPDGGASDRQARAVGAALSSNAIVVCPTCMAVAHGNALCRTCRSHWPGGDPLLYIESAGCCGDPGDCDEMLRNQSRQEAA